MALTDKRDTRCHLLCLPPELRLCIYDHYFGSKKSCYVTWTNMVNGISTHWDNDHKQPLRNTSGSVILRTCKAIHAEALPVMLASSSLHIDTGYRTSNLFCRESCWTTARVHNSDDDLSFLSNLPNVQLRLHLDGWLPDDEFEHQATLFKAMEYCKKSSR